MRIRMLVTLSGTRNGQDWPAKGGALEVPDDEGAQLCATGIAEPVAEIGETQKAVLPEVSERRRGRPRKPRDAEGNIIKE
ncbi:hypothetical protein [Streptomyces sp. KR55]|uniref:hypothetical protein n=1 Tax=Streptomyces sp. KR55 TaxID=3457425 RepID=UPI003FCF1F21